MPNTIRKVSYAYVTAGSKPGEAARILQALRDANVNLLAFSGFPQGRSKAQIDVVTDDLDALKGVARGRKWRLSRIKRAFLVRSLHEEGPLDAAQPPFPAPGDAFQSVEVVGHHVDLRLASPLWKAGKREQVDVRVAQRLEDARRLAGLARGRDVRVAHLANGVRHRDSQDYRRSGRHDAILCRGSPQ